MLSSTVIDFFAAQLIEKGIKKPGLFISLLANIGFLIWFKYANFTYDNFAALCEVFNFDFKSLVHIPQIALPIGISFYTFQTMSYTIDVFRGNVEANKNFIDFACYVTMFPQLVAGPIVRYTDIKQELVTRETNFNKISIGTERFIVGLAKKVLIANTFAYIADAVFTTPEYAMNASLAWLGIIAYSIQIYFDFSGYSDMAIGLALIIGFTIPENFNFPYIAKSIKDFWRRWHISLSQWLRDYVYISLGGNRKGKIWTYTNLFIVFFVTGLWHGASWNFVVWGLFHGTFLVIERIGFDKVLGKLWSPIQHIYTLLVVIIGWVFFRADDLGHAVWYIKKMFTINLGTNIISCTQYINPEVLFMGLLATIFSTPIYRTMRISMRIPFILTPIPSCFIKTVLLIIFIISILYVASSAYNPFIYFRF